jgi:pimeloyl-ACP methyl ester carboxylesterase
VQGVITTLVAGAIAYLGLCAWLYLTQRSQIYFPTPETRHPGAEAVWIKSTDAKLKVWTVSRPGPQALVYFGGNAEDVAGNLEDLARVFPDHSLYLVNYRGYGGSTGQPSEAGLYADALAVHDVVRAVHGEVAVMGRSLGASVAVHLASERPVERLVLVTPFDSLVNVARGHFRWVPVGWLLKERYESTRRAAAIRAPVLMVIAGNDEIIPDARSRALAAAFTPRRPRIVVIPGTTHNTLDLSPAYLRTVHAFLAE